MEHAYFVGMYAIPLQQDIEESECVPNAALQVGPFAMHHFLEMAHQSQPRQRRFEHHAVVPFATLAQPQVVRMSPLLGKAYVGKDNHVIEDTFDNVLKGRAIIDIRRVTIPVDDQAQMVLQQTPFCADNPTCVRLAFASDLLWTAPFAPWVNQFDAIRVNHAKHGRLSHKQVYPLAMRVEQAEQTRPRRQVGKQIPPVPLQPTIERAVASALERKEQGQGDHFTGIECCLAMFVHIGHVVIYEAEQIYDKNLQYSRGSPFCFGFDT
jgi:hypothetical protein